MSHNRRSRLWIPALFLLLSGAPASPASADPPTTLIPPDSQPFAAAPRSLAAVSCSRRVGLVGNYFSGSIDSFLAAQGNSVVAVTPAFLAGGGLASLDVLYILRDGTSTALSYAPIIEAWVRAGGTLITEFSATDTVLQSFGFCSAGALAVSFGVPSGTVCGGNTVTIQSPGHPLATGLPASWSCTGNPIGVFRVFNNLDPAFEIVATGQADLNNDGQPDPVVATCCADRGVWVAFFTDFGDWAPLQNPIPCGGGSCARASEEETLLLNAVCLATDSCASITCSQGFWKNHPEEWTRLDPTASPSWGGGRSYLEILRTPPKQGDASILLAHAYIAASLNTGASASDLNAARALLEAHPIGSGDLTAKGKATHRDRARAIAIASALQAFNERGACSLDD
jgi:hypothetical protein